MFSSEKLIAGTATKHTDPDATGLELTSELSEQEQITLKPPTAGDPQTLSDQLLCICACSKIPKDHKMGSRYKF